MDIPKKMSRHLAHHVLTSFFYLLTSFPQTQVAYKAGSIGKHNNPLNLISMGYRHMPHEIFFIARTPNTSSFIIFIQGRLIYVQGKNIFLI